MSIPGPAPAPECPTASQPESGSESAGGARLDTLATAPSTSLGTEKVNSWIAAMFAAAHDDDRAAPEHRAFATDGRRRERVTAPCSRSRDRRRCCDADGLAVARREVTSPGASAPRSRDTDSPGAVLRSVRNRTFPTVPG